MALSQQFWALRGEIFEDRTVHGAETMLEAKSLFVSFFFEP